MLTSKLRGHLAMARISNSPTVVTNVIAGAALGGGFHQQNLGTLIGLSIVLLMLYTAGMYLNDLCDFRIDREERAERPLVQGIVTKQEAWVVVMLLFVGAIIALFRIDVALLPLGLILVILIIVYDLWHKKNPLSPVIMGANRFMVYLIAFRAFEQTFSFEILLAGAMLWIYILGVTLIAKQENSGQLTRYYPVAILLIPALFPIVIPTIEAWGMALIFAGWIFYSAHLIYTHRSIRQGVGALLAGICLLDGVVMSTYLGIIGMMIGIAGLMLTLYLHHFIKGT